MLSGFGFYRFTILNPALHFYVWNALRTLPHTLSLIPNDQRRGRDCRTPNIWMFTNMQFFEWSLLWLVWLCQSSLTLLINNQPQKFPWIICLGAIQTQSLLTKKELSVQKKSHVKCCISTFYTSNPPSDCWWPLGRCSAAWAPDGLEKPVFVLNTHFRKHQRVQIGKKP